MKKNGPNEKAILASFFTDQLSKGDRTKLALIRSALDIIGREGIDHLTFESAGKSVGCNRAQVRYHFPDKEDLVYRAMEYMWATYQEHLVRILGTARNWRERVEAILTGIFDFCDENPVMASAWLYFYYATRTKPKYRELLQKLDAMGQKRMIAILEEGREEMGWPQRSLPSLAQNLWAVIEGLAFFHLAIPRPERGYYRKEARKGVERLIGP